jgi:hypothetical protein
MTEESARGTGLAEARRPIPGAVRVVALVVLAASATGEAERQPGPRPAPADLRFEVTLDPLSASGPQSGRLFVVISRDERPEPRLRIGRTGLDGPIVIGRDASLSAGGRVSVGRGAATFPLDDLAKLQAGDYFVQALLDTNRDLKSVNAPGNLYSDVRRVRIDPAAGGLVSLVLSRRVPSEQLPPERDHVRWVKLRSELLSAFHGRPIYLRAGLLLPRGYDTEPERRYPLRVRIGGYGASYTGVERLLREGSEFRTAWLSDAAPRMLLLHLDGDGPYGDPYQVNSANHGPYGDAVTQELIPYVERTFRGLARPDARVVDGGSTGGWVSLALQVFYPDFFNGAWSYCPDSVDFRAFQLLDIYSDTNAYVNRNGFERPSARDVNGDVRFTMRHECQMENVMGAGDGWHMSGGQWGAWNATYGPRGRDGRPVPLWDPKTGAIDRPVVDHWKRYDLRLALENNWASLGPKLRGKINIWVGEADNYFLNNAVHLLDEFLSRATPPYEGRIVYGPGQGHCWKGLPELEIMQEMGRRTGATP